MLILHFPIVRHRITNWTIKIKNIFLKTKIVEKCIKSLWAFNKSFHIGNAYHHSAPQDPLSSISQCSLIPKDSMQNSQYFCYPTDRTQKLKRTPKS